MTSTATGPVKLSELVASVSLFTDLGMGQPMEQAMVTCLLSVNAGQELGLDDETLSDVHYLALLRFIGCTADASEFAAAVGGDDIAQRAGLAPVLNGEPAEFLRHMLRHFGEGASVISRVRLVGGALADGTKGAKRSIADHCLVAQMLAPRIGISQTVARNIGSTFERWDGKGLPGELSGQEIPVACRIVMVSRDVDIVTRLGGWPLAEEYLQRRRGKAYDPSVAGVFLEFGERWLRQAQQQQVGDAVIAAEPGTPSHIPESSLDDALTALADLADLKSPFAAGHSRAVAEIAAGAAKAMGFDEQQISTVRRAGLLHDLGKAGVPSGILDKPGPLSQGEWERVRLHPYYTERVVSYVPALRAVGEVACAHHERLDGSGYHRGAAAANLSAPARVLAAANAYQTLTQERPYRPALDAPARERELTRKASDGKLDRQAVSAVLSVAGHTVRTPARGEWPAGLTDREVEVLRLISQGRSNRSVAEELTISVKTVGRHIENIYAKTSVSSRATAALFAMQHNLV